MDLLALRNATAEDHDATEASLPLLSPELTLAGYAATLERMHGFVRGWELWAAEAVPADLRPMLQPRRRSALLEQDLRFLHAEVPSSVAEIPLTPGSAETFLGALYVMEGSTLGGQYLATHLENHFQFARGSGNAYFVGYGSSTGSMWNEVRTVLKAVPEQESEALTNSAKTMFAAFRLWMTHPAGEDAASNKSEPARHV